jgi:hypothetical protein
MEIEDGSLTTIRMHEKKERDLKKQVSTLQRKLAQGSQQAQGEVQEIELGSVLKDACPWDEIEKVKSGIRGADIIQRVRANEQDAGQVILWECKNAARWRAEWVRKLKDDMRLEGAPLGVIVSNVLPSGFDSFGPHDGVFLCKLRFVKQFAGLLRTIILKEEQALAAVAGRTSKAERLYDYLTSNQFAARIRGVLETFSSMHLNIQRQKRLMSNLWTQQEREMEGIALELAGLAGDVQGIAGPDAKGLDALGRGQELLGSQGDSISQATLLSIASD